MRSSLPTPVSVELFWETPGGFFATVAGERLDLTSHLANLCVLGYLFGSPKDAGLVTGTGVYGAPTSETSPGSVELTGDVTGELHTTTSIELLDGERVLALAGLGLLQTLTDAFS